MRRIGELERRVERAEATLAALEDELADPSLWSSPTRTQRATKRHAEAKRAVEAGATCTIVSSDKDLMQLIRPGVELMDPIKKTKLGPEAVMEKFGVTPDKVIDVQALAGDSTDNVPGVPGIGVKTAAQLIGEYGDLETLLSRATEIKQEKRRQALIDNAEKARISKVLVTLDDKVKLEVPLADLAVHEPDYTRLIAFLKAMEFSTLTRRVAEFSGADGAAVRQGSATASTRLWTALLPSRLLSRCPVPPRPPRRHSRRPHPGCAGLLPCRWRPGGSSSRWRVPIGSARRSARPGPCWRCWWF